MNKPININVLSKAYLKPYGVIIGISLRDAIREIRSRFSNRKIFAVTDSNVYNYYGSSLLKNEWTTIVIQAGERSKSRRSKELIEDQLLSNKASRDSIIVAFGGGMIGDLAGFTAATFMRGISYIQIPTTLLSQVDSSIGSKVAINHPMGKNLIGAFHRPEAVYIDIDTLKTLPVKEFRQGLAEIIKYAAILDADLFKYLENNHQRIISRDADSLLHIIVRCVKLKKHIVEKDERESNIRRILNFGHTIGHALESYHRYRIPHGNAVAIGMSVEAEFARGSGLLNKESLDRLNRLIARYHLPTAIPRGTDKTRLLALTAADKKRLNKRVRYTLIESIGKGRVDITLNEKFLKKILIK